MAADVTAASDPVTDCNEERVVEKEPFAVFTSLSAPSERVMPLTLRASTAMLTPAPFCSMILPFLTVISPVQVVLKPSGRMISPPLVISNVLSYS